MKAKVKATGKVIEATINKCAVPVQGCGASSVYQGDDGKTYFDNELDFIHVYPDWQQVRIQAAIAAMGGFCANKICLEKCTYDERAELSIAQADALVEKLKETM